MCVLVRLSRNVLLVPWDPSGNGDYYFVSAWGQASFKDGGMSRTGWLWASLVGRGPWGQEGLTQAREYKRAAVALEQDIEEHQER